MVSALGLMAAGAWNLWPLQNALAGASPEVALDVCVVAPRPRLTTGP